VREKDRKPVGCEREFLYGPFAIAPRAIQSRTGNGRAERKREENRMEERKRERETRKETHVAICWIIREEKTGVSNRRSSRVEKQNRDESRNESIT
jgi:hypothetical protein